MHNYSATWHSLMIRLQTRLHWPSARYLGLELGAWPVLRYVWLVIISSSVVSNQSQTTIIVQIYTCVCDLAPGVGRGGGGGLGWLPRHLYFYPWLELKGSVLIVHGLYGYGWLGHAPCLVYYNNIKNELKYYHNNLLTHSGVDVVHGCFPRGGDSILSVFSWEPLRMNLRDY